MLPKQVNTLRLRQNGHHFADIFKWISLNENFWILNRISLKYVPLGQMGNMTALVQIMAWPQTGKKSLSEPMSVCCTDAYICHSASMVNNTLRLRQNGCFLADIISNWFSCMNCIAFWFRFEWIWSPRAPLTNWGWDKMAAVSQTTLSNAFSWMKMLEFRLRFHWSLSLRAQLTIIHHWFR